MKLVEMTEKDYENVIGMAKEIFNFDYLLSEKNDQFNYALSRFVGSTIAKDITNGAFIETSEGKKVAMMAYAIPGKNPIFSSLETDSQTNLKMFKKYIKENKITNNEKLIINKEIDVARCFHALFNEYEKFLDNKVEIKFLYVDQNYRGKFLSKILFKKFYDDLLINGYDSFYLFTTTENNYKFYERIKMKSLELVVYNNENSPEYFKYKFKLPYKTMIYLGNKKEVVF